MPPIEVSPIRCGHCGAPVSPVAGEAAVRCGGCSSTLPLPIAPAAPSAAGAAKPSARGLGGRVALVLALGAALVLILSAIGAAIVYFGRRSGFVETAVTPDMPLERDDSVIVRSASTTCTLRVEAIEPNGLIKTSSGCPANGQPALYPRDRLRLEMANPDFVHTNDAVLVRLASGWKRGDVVTVRSDKRILVRFASGGEQPIDPASVAIVQRAFERKTR